MPYLIGTDEAGYAPNLGPLVISASVWRIEGELADGDLYARLKRHVCRTPRRTSGRARLAIADSKALYSPAVGLAHLERGVLAALRLVDCPAATWSQVWSALDADSAAAQIELPWHLDYDPNLPLAADGDELERLVPWLRAGLARAGVRLVALRSRAVFPDEFNAATERLGNKAEALSQITLGLVDEMLAGCGGEPTLVVCDKHGGRNCYGRLLQQQFPERLVEVYRESGPVSVYRWGDDEARVEVQFRAGGEDFLPAALASMTAKYLRELAMRAFNDYWCARVPDLAPTAGYPGDAGRFKRAIEPVQAALGIADHVVWRTR